MREIDPKIKKRQNLKGRGKIWREETILPDFWGIEGAFDWEINNVVSSSRLQHSSMSDTVPRSELTQLHSVIRRECSFQRQSHRRPRNSSRRRQQHDGEENSGGYHWCRWVSSKYRKWEMGKQSGIAILIEHQNKKQQIGVEDAVSVIVVEEFHDHNYTHRETERVREPTSCKFQVTQLSNGLRGVTLLVCITI